jgi:hypothetical protein
MKFTDINKSGNSFFFPQKCSGNPPPATPEPQPIPPKDFRVSLLSGKPKKKGNDASGLLTDEEVQ